MAVSRTARVAAWIVAVVAGLVSVGLIVMLVADPGMADLAAAVTGAVVGLIALALSVATLVRGSGSRGGRPQVRSERGGVAAGGDVVGNAAGDHSTVVGRPSTPGRNRGAGQRADVRAGRDAIAAAGDVRDNALGDGAERR
ncbi:MULTISPECIES: hypothetical protein [unclassified Streptomyces]|uniref:hypothetical protein n=1 Tax=unclassified Streptomyces TaxID=2593676 RepID=UPI0011CE1EC5|nr:MULTISPECIES: hypothetical protein [unclassified Streptomyces]MCX4448978.1 hypothetical protein [Streptomyces sp. NBC_01789]